MLSLQSTKYKNRKILFYYFLPLWSGVKWISPLLKNFSVTGKTLAQIFQFTNLLLIISARSTLILLNCSKTSNSFPGPFLFHGENHHISPKEGSKTSVILLSYLMIFIYSIVVEIYLTENRYHRSYWHLENKNTRQLVKSKKMKINKVLRLEKYLIEKDYAGLYFSFHYLPLETLTKGNLSYI